MAFVLLLLSIFAIWVSDYSKFLFWVMYCIILGITILRVKVK